MAAGGVAQLAVMGSGATRRRMAAEDVAQLAISACCCGRGRSHGPVTCTPVGGRWGSRPAGRRGEGEGEGVSPWGGVRQRQEVKEGWISRAYVSRHSETCEASVQ